MSTPISGEYYRCSCPHCSYRYYDSLPPRVCRRCGSADLVVGVDRLKRAKELADTLPQTTTADRMERTHAPNTL